MSLLSGRNLRVRRDRSDILHGVSVEIAAGEIVTLVGPNGSGKSTLLRTLIGALTPDAGTVSRAPGLRIGYVPQKLAIDATLPMTVRRFLDLPVKASRGCRIGRWWSFPAGSSSACCWRARS